MELPVPELAIGDRVIPLRGRAFRLEAVLAAGAADSLDVALGVEGAAEIPGRPGEPAVLRLAGEDRFRGSVERASILSGPREGTVLEVAARASWIGRARALPLEEEYREVTDAEVAARIADALGLAGRIDPTPEVHRRLERRGDPLAFLLGRARAAGRLAGIAAGGLHFSARLPAGAVHEVGPHVPVLAFRASERAGGRSGTVVLAGDPGVSPLDRLRLPGLGPASGGVLRVSRVRIRMGPLGFSVEVSWVEEGADLALAGEDGGWDPPAGMAGIPPREGGWEEAAG